jgi:nitrogen permease regulator 3-like protein
MSDPCLLAIFFVSSSSKGSHLAFRWPARPKAVLRLARPYPIVNQVDYAWRAAHPSAESSLEPPDKPFSIGTNGGKERQESIKGLGLENMEGETPIHTPAYEWRLQDWSDHWISHTDQNQHSNSRRRGRDSRKNTNTGFNEYSNEHPDPQFDWVLGFRTKILAEHVFRFDRKLCNQRFELILEELLFLGHPVCIGEDGTWMWDQLYKDRNKTSTSKDDENEGDKDAIEVERNQASAAAAAMGVSDPTKEASLKSFHFILVLDRPAPALGGHMNLTRFIDVYYEQIAVKMTAALHFEQSRDGYVEKETDLLVDLMEGERSVP